MEIQCPPGFVLESYIGRYAGPTRLLRLQALLAPDLPTTAASSASAANSAAGGGGGASPETSSPLQCPVYPVALQAEAAALLAQEIVSGLNTELAAQVAAAAGDGGGGVTGSVLAAEAVAAALPAEWAEHANAEAVATFQSLEAAVVSARAGGGKAATRRAHDALGHFLVKRGDPQGALKHLIRARDYCTGPCEVAEACLSVASLALSLGNAVQCANHVAKAEHAIQCIGVPTPGGGVSGGGEAAGGGYGGYGEAGEAGEAGGGGGGLAGGGGALRAQAWALKGLLDLQQRNYKDAARRFFEVGPELGDSLRSVLVCEDAAALAALCALAACGRDEVQAKLLGPAHRHTAQHTTPAASTSTTSTSTGGGGGGGGGAPSSSSSASASSGAAAAAVKPLLELVPPLRQALEHLHGVERSYGAGLALLGQQRGALLLDPWLRPHADALLDAIRDRCVLQYFSPYLSVRLSSMAAAFNMDVAAMEGVCAALVMDGKLAARIDSERKSLHVRTGSERGEAYAKVAALSSAYLGDMQGLLLRMSCVEHGVTTTQSQTNSSSSSHTHGGGGGYGLSMLEAFGGGGGGGGALLMGEEEEEGEEEGGHFPGHQAASSEDMVDDL